MLVLSAAVLVLVIERRRDDGHHLGSRETRCVPSGTGIRGRWLYPLKDKVKRMVAMLPRLAMRSERGSESSACCGAAIDYEHEHEHRCAEHE